MYPKKPGGGGFPELYDPENGQYVSDEEKAKLLDDEIGNIVMRYLFGINDTYNPRFPIFGFHSDEYCELYVKYSICKVYKDLSYQKIEYLLSPRNVDDKSNFFKLIGYNFNKDDRNKLFQQIMDGADFSKMKFNKLTEYGLFVKVPTRIYNIKEHKYVYITTIWRYGKDEQFYFITAIPRIMEEKR